MNNEMLAWVVPLVMTGLVGAVVWIVKLAVDLMSMRKDNERQAEDIKRLTADVEKHDEWDRAQHKELFDRGLADAKLLERLMALVETVSKNVDEILERERARNGVSH